MSYHPTRRSLGSISSQPATLPRMVRTKLRRPLGALGSLGDEPGGATTLSTPTVQDPATGQWQAKVLTQLEEGVRTLEMANTQKWLQIAATISIPLSAAIWRAIFRRGASDPTM